jgi:hypothetical protein
LPEYLHELSPTTISMVQEGPSTVVTDLLGSLQASNLVSRAEAEYQMDDIIHQL